VDEAVSGEEDGRGESFLMCLHALRKAAIETRATATRHVQMPARVVACVRCRTPAHSVTMPAAMSATRNQSLLFSATHAPRLFAASSSSIFSTSTATHPDCVCGLKLGWRSSTPVKEALGGAALVSSCSSR